MYSFTVMDDRTGIRNLAKLYVGVPIAERIGHSGVPGLCTFPSPYNLQAETQSAQVSCTNHESGSLYFGVSQEVFRDSSVHSR